MKETTHKFTHTITKTLVDDIKTLLNETCLLNMAHVFNKNKYTLLYYISYFVFLLCITFYETIEQQKKQHNVGLKFLIYTQQRINFNTAEFKF